ncbi:MAG: PolC-type DNA polymerase III [Anaeroplasmataceae bacterium]
MDYLEFIKNENVFDFNNNEIKIDSVSVDKEKRCFYVDIVIKKALNYKAFENFMASNKKLFNNIGFTYEINLIYEGMELSNDEIKEYFLYVLDNLLAVSPFYSTVKDFEYNIEGNTITILVDEITKLYNDCATNIEEGLHDLSLDINVCLEVSDKAKSLKEQRLQEVKEIDENLRKKRLDDAKEAQRLTELQIKNDKNYKRKYSNEVTSIIDIPVNQDGIDRYQYEKGELFITIEGEIFESVCEPKGKSNLLSLKVTDYTDSILITKWLRTEEEVKKAKEYEPGIIVRVSGKAEYNNYVKAVVLSASTITPISKAIKKKRVDGAEVKRVELHAHTKFTNMDGLSSVDDYIECANAWGHKAIAFTDRNGVYNISDVAHSKKLGDLKPIFGVELDYLDDSKFSITYAPADIPLESATYVVFDLETTGFSQNYDDIIEIGAHKLRDGKIVDAYETFVNPRRPIPAGITELTSITDDMVKNSPTIDVALKEFLDFSEGCILVAHNASFDIGMVRANIRRLGLLDKPLVGIDTLNLSRALYNKELKQFNLKAICKYFHVKQEHHHRATDDTKVTALCFINMLNDLKNRNINNYSEINNVIDSEFYNEVIPSRINILVKNQVGYKNMYKLVSDALTVHLARDARLLKSVLESLRDGILVTSSGAAGNVFECALNRSDEELEDAISYVDIVEVQPISSYNHLIAFLNDGHNGKEIIINTIKKIIKTAEKLNKIVVATSDCYYINPDQKQYREILIGTNQVGGGVHELKRYQDKYNASPNAHLRTTEEMLQEFNFLDPELAYEIVVTNTNIVADMIEPVRCFHKKMFVPADDEFKDHPDPKYRFPSMIDAMNKIVADNVRDTYGENPHPFVKARVDRELKSIISSGYYSTYFMAHLMVKDSLEHGYLVGSRGSVGSSFVATMMNITEVNPLPPHYICPHCKFMAIKFSKEDEVNVNSKEELELQELLRQYNDGYDLPDMQCPICNHPLHKDGHDIPFETFLGFNGDKVPDIDLNFSGEYQPQAHLFVRHLMGYDNSFRGGTVGTIAENTAFGIVREYETKKGRELRGPEIERLSKNLIDIKRSTGQHPGGIVVVPKEIDIYDVTPIQYPANDKTSPWRTTHFDYHAFEDNLLKLDILGHDDPTLIKYFMDIVHEHQDEFPFSDPTKIPVDDKNVFSLFGSTKAIGVEPDDIDSEVASFAVPELGTNFVRQMLLDTKPQSFAGLVKISGLSHGTGVWVGNSKTLVGKENPSQFGIISFEQIIGCRDDIMVDLMFFGLEPLKAFKIMEFVRKGKVKKDPEGWNPFREALVEKNVPEWYIWSCEQIEYMFPKAHAVAYVLMALRIAWFKVYKPAMFYSAYFSKRAKAYDVDAFLGGSPAIKARLHELSQTKDKTAKTEDLITSLGVALECVARGIKFLNIDIFTSDATVFSVEGTLTDGNLRLPFAAVDGLGESVALDIVEKRNEKMFTSKKDVLNRTKLNQTLYEKFDAMGAFGNLPEDDPEENVGLFALDL